MFWQPRWEVGNPVRIRGNSREIFQVLWVGRLKTPLMKHADFVYLLNDGLEECYYEEELTGAFGPQDE